MDIEAIAQQLAERREYLKSPERQWKTGYDAELHWLGLMAPRYSAADFAHRIIAVEGPLESPRDQGALSGMTDFFKTLPLGEAVIALLLEHRALVADLEARLPKVHAEQPESAQSNPELTPVPATFHSGASLGPPEGGPSPCNEPQVQADPQGLFPTPIPSQVSSLSQDTGAHAGPSRAGEIPPENPIQAVFSAVDELTAEILGSILEAQSRPTPVELDRPKNRLEILLDPEAFKKNLQALEDSLGRKLDRLGRTDNKRSFEDDLDTARQQIRELLAYEALTSEERQRKDAQNSWACYADLPYVATYEVFRAFRRQPAEDDIFAQEYKRCALAWLEEHPQKESIQALLAEFGGELNGA